MTFLDKTIFRALLVIFFDEKTILRMSFKIIRYYIFEILMISSEARIRAEWAQTHPKNLENLLKIAN